jgi:hypothetical protein
MAGSESFGVDARDVRIREYFALADEWGLRPTVELYGRFIAGDVVVQFGGGEPMRGLQTLIDSAPGMEAVVSDIKHELVMIHHDVGGKYVTVEMVVTYNRRQGGPLTVPCATILGFDEDELISEYRIYLDAGDLFRS